jgi:hypothetical protein
MGAMIHQILSDAEKSVFRSSVPDSSKKLFEEKSAASRVDPSKFGRSGFAMTDIAHATKGATS